ncbi:MAG TPA: bifunctional diaminohydroxyphosphoribosylaminopyrimidine deaminase/5-amino-6-(5-phosphoribosylamino)uracil reductase RibD, partial [Armatimonadota bacterium]|nr:bifunctional diaminohydroxyphosphoribosylaminopyrimidine deaminase/5-amino-6-(5-phosphoribosylamino)uracil reductase RibD [Armatimonadota bacterium]
MARGDTAGATLYVTLEPCTGERKKTPPCCDAVLRAGFVRVVIGARDPTQAPATERLRKAGVEVIEGVLGAGCRRMIAPFLKLKGRGRPWVSAKWAMSADGRIATATGDSRWISCEASRELVHRWRNEIDAILVGSGTARRDDPELTCRLPGGRSPRRIVLDGQASLATESRLVRTMDRAPVIVACLETAPEENRRRLAERGCRVLPLPAWGERVDADALLAALGAEGLRAKTAEHLATPLLRDTLGAMDRAELARYAMARLEAPPDYRRYPELEDLYPEKVDALRGLAQGAEVSLAEAAVYSYVDYRALIDHWYSVYQLQRDPGHCSGVIMVGPDGVLGGQSAESAPPPKPAAWRWRPPKPYAGLQPLKTQCPALTLRRPRTGYIEGWGVTNEKGVACVAGNSCGVWLDEPIEDTWPIGQVPLLRFARDIDHLEELSRRYTLFNWGRGSIAYADITGHAMIVEKSYRRIGIRRLKPGAQAIWCTEGHWETPEMGGYLRAKRLEYLEKAGKHLGADDLQYAT